MRQTTAVIQIGTLQQEENESQQEPWLFSLTFLYLNHYGKVPFPLGKALFQSVNAPWKSFHKPASELLSHLILEQMN